MRLTSGLLFFAIASIALSFEAYGAGDEEMLTAEQVASGEYTDLEFWGRVRIGTSPYVNAALLERVAVNYRYDSNDPDFRESALYAGLIDNTVMVGEITDRGSYNVVPLGSDGVPWMIDITRGTDPNQWDDIGEVAEELTSRFNSYVQFRPDDAAQEISPTIEAWYNFAKWYALTENLTIETSAYNSIEEVLSLYRSFPLLDDMATSGADDWRSYVRWYIAVGSFVPGVSACNTDSVASRYFEINPALGGTSGTDTLTPEPELELGVADTLRELQETCSRDSAIAVTLEDNEIQIQFESVDFLKNWNRFAQWYGREGGSDSGFRWRIDFPFDDPVFVGVSPSVNDIEGRPVVSWSATEIQP